MNRNRSQKEERCLYRCTTMILGIVMSFIPACAIFQNLADYQQAVDVIAPTVKSPCTALGILAICTLVTYAFVWYGISRKILRGIGFGIFVMIVLMTLTVVTQYDIHSVAFQSEELSIKRMNRSEIQMRHLLETSVNGLNGIQRSLKCCGLDNYTDWNSNAVFKCVSPSMSTSSCSIPETCCEDYYNWADSSHSRSRVLFLQTKRIPDHCGKDALKPFVGLPYEKPEKSNSASNSKDMKKNMIFEDGCLKKAKTFLSDFGDKNLMLGAFILVSQVFGVIASVGYFILIRRRGDCESETQNTARDRNDDNNQRNALQPRRNSNVDNSSNSFELKEIDSSFNIATENESEDESDTATVLLSDTESRKSVACVQLSEIASKKPAATTNRQHSESRNDAAATNQIDTGSVHPTDTDSEKSVSVKLSNIESKTANPNHSESRNNDEAAASSLTTTESMKRATDDVNPPVFESTNGSEASCSTIDVGSRPNSSDSECNLGFKSSPTYKMITAIFENTAGHKLEESQELLASEDSDAEDSTESYLYDWNEMFFVTTRV